MKKIVFCFLFFAAWNLGFSQTAVPKNGNDTLWGIWLDETKPDTVRVKAVHSYTFREYLFSKPDSAMYFLNLMYDFAKIHELKKYEATALNLMGVSNTVRGNIADALIYYAGSLKIYEEIGNKKGISSVLTNFGNSYFQFGDYSKALSYFMLGLKIAEEINDKFGIAAALNNFGIIYFSQGDYQKAIENYQQAMSVYVELKDQQGLALALSNLGQVYNELNEFDPALENINRSMKMYEEIGYTNGVARCLNNLGWMYNQNKEYTKAIGFLEKCLLINEDLEDKNSICVALVNLSWAYASQGNYTTAIALCTKSYQLALETRYTENENGASKALSILFSHLDQPDSGIFYLNLLYKGLQKDLMMNYFTLDEHAKELYFAGTEADFSLYYDFAVFYHTTFSSLPDTAYNMALQNKGLTLKSSTAMRMVINNSGDSLLILEYNNWINLKRKISALYSNGADTKGLEDEARQLEKELISKSAVFSDFEKIKKLNWKEIRASLKPDECAIEFIHFKSEIDTTNPIIYAALLIKPESEHPEVIRLCYESDLVEILGTFQGNNLVFVNAVYGTREEAQTALYQKIWQPLEKYLGGVKTVFYSPSGLLHKISFASISKSQNVYLSDIYNFRQMGSTGKIALPDDVAFGELENFLLMGGVNYSSVNSDKDVWSYLPGSLQETESINSFLQKKKFGVNYFHSNNASEEIFKEKIVSSSIVHIATHGFFFPDPEKVREEMKEDSESNKDLKFRGATNYANWSFVNNKNPLMRSGIVLANANNVWERDALAEGEDGILTAQEVSNLDLRNTKLVVLSACETGLGDIHGSEGVFGLQRAFKMAGVNYLIMSLWQVPDKETSEFMQLFYRNLIKEKDIPVAFQKTQKVMRQKYDPYFWGAFVLIE